MTPYREMNDDLRLLHRSVSAVQIFYLQEVANLNKVGLTGRMTLKTYDLK